ncbi:MAG: type 1 glutamine amidotransferase-like domain-containing protein [Bacteroidales bacterium]|nr:type 1 glutamine amidotransferase-like domain-containing protein [Bacteroidales bacterium]
MTKKLPFFFPYAWNYYFPWNDYEKRIREKFQNLGHQLVSVHHSSDPVKSIEDAEVIVIGGGNTFNLIYWIKKLNLIEPIRKKSVKRNTLYWMERRIKMWLVPLYVLPTICR